MEGRSYSPEMVEAAKAELLRRKQAAQAELDKRQKDEGVLSSLSNIPGYAAGAAITWPGKIIDLAKQLPSTGKKILTQPIDSVRDLAGGIARGSQNLATAALEYGQHSSQKDLERYNKISGKKLKLPAFNAREFMGLEGEAPIDLGSYIESKNPDPLLSGLGQYGLGGAAGGVRALPMLAANALNMGLQAKPGERLKSAVEGAVNVGLPLGAAKAGNALRPSRFLAGELSPEELARNLEATQGTNTNLGDVLGSPNLKRFYENILSRVPFSGANDVMQKTAQQVVEKGQQHLGKLAEDLPEGKLSGSVLQDALKKAAKEASAENIKNFSTVNKIADEDGLVVPRTNLQTKAKEILEEIEKSHELKREMDPALLADIESYAKNPQGNSLKLTNIFKGKLNDKASDFYVSGKKHEYSIMRELKDALGDDINEGIKNSSNTKLKSAYDHAQEQHGIYASQFEDPDITLFTRKGGDPELMLSHFLRIGQNDRANLLQKVVAKLPEKLRSLPAYMYLSRAVNEEGQLDPSKFSTLYSKLGKNQREVLIEDPAMRKALKSYTDLVRMNSQGLHSMFNPMTGQRNMDVIGAASALGGSSALSNLLGGGILGHALGGIAGVALPAIGGKMAVKYITSPNVRESLVKAIIKSKQKQK